VLGVRILSAPDAAGDFELERARRHVGEAASPTFLAPHRREDRLISAGRDSPATQSAQPDPREGYNAAKVGYTHLMAYSKRAPEVMRRLADRVRREWPEFHRRCVRRPDLMPAD
jgi:hypothetical protein